MQRLPLFAVAFMLAMWTTMSAWAQDGPSETRRFNGVYVNGWEVQLFIENGRENEQPYWIAMTPEARAAVGAVLPDEFEPGEGVRVHITFDGRLSPPGRYGHLGVYSHTVLVENVIHAELEGRPAAYCDAAIDGEWASASGQRFRVEATTSGPTCRQSAAVIIVRNAAGDVVWTDARPAALVAGLNTPTTRTPMTYALRDWIGLAARGQTTADLPPWPRREPGPTSSSGFEFEPEPWINREHYLAMRARGADVLLRARAREPGLPRRTGQQTRKNWRPSLPRLSSTGDAVQTINLTATAVIATGLASAL